MILTYRILSNILYPFILIFVFYRKIIKKEDPIRYKEKILTSHFKVTNKKNSKLVWFHAASIGELKSIIPIINQLNLNHNRLKFLITTSTFSSGNIAQEEFKKIDNVEHRYFPYDISFLIDKFLNLWSPDVIFLVDSEIWPNLILKAKKYKIPISLINARLTLKSYKRWMRFPKTAKKLFNVFDLFICSNSETKTYLKELGLKNIYFKGNIKLAEFINEKDIENINKKFFNKRNFWLAASTHKEEDIFCLKTHLKLKEKFNDVITLIAPRHIERSREIYLLSEKFNLKAQILNQNENILDNKEIIIINYFGALKSYFKFTKSVFMGKSMIVKYKYDGGQNPIEAAKLNCKIYHGPYVTNFGDIYEILAKKNISTKIDDHNELSKNLAMDFENLDNAKEKNKIAINSLGKKTLHDTMEIINNFINHENK